MFKYNAALLCEAITSIQDACKLSVDLVEQAKDINSDLPEDLTCADVLHSIEQDVNTFSQKVMGLIGVLNSITSKLSKADSNFRSKLMELGVIPGMISIFTDASSNMYKSWYAVDNLTADDLEYVKAHWNEILYSEQFGYGANQEAPLDWYINGDKYIEKIIRKYYPNMSEDEVVDFLVGLSNTGCGYAATANYIYEGYANKPEQFEKDYGFPMYFKDDNGNYISNVNYLAVDIYSYTHSQNLDITDNRLMVSGKINPKYKAENVGKVEYSTTGSTGVGSGTNLNDLGIIIDDKKYSNSSINYEIVKSSNNNTSINYEKEVEKAVNSGKCVLIGADDYDLYMPDSNNNRDNTFEVDSRVNAGHWMTITDVTESGDYVVSTWGEERLLDPNSLDVNYDLAIIKTDERGE